MSQDICGQDRCCRLLQQHKRNENGEKPHPKLRKRCERAENLLGFFQEVFFGQMRSRLFWVSACVLLCGLGVPRHFNSNPIKRQRHLPTQVSGGGSILTWNLFLVGPAALVRETPSFISLLMCKYTKTSLSRDKAALWQGAVFLRRKVPLPSKL